MATEEPTEPESYQSYAVYQGQKILVCTGVTGCGSPVVDMVLHDEWHQRLEQAGV